MARRSTTEEETQEINPNDPDVRTERERAVEYGQRVLAGERPWDNDDAEAEPEAQEYEPAE